MAGKLYPHLTDSIMGVNCSSLKLAMMFFAAQSAQGLSGRSSDPDHQLRFRHCGHCTSLGACFAQYRPPTELSSAASSQKLHLTIMAFSISRGPVIAALRLAKKPCARRRIQLREFRNFKAIAFAVGNQIPARADFRNRFVDYARGQCTRAAVGFDFPLR